MTVVGKITQILTNKAFLDSKVLIVFSFCSIGATD